MNLSDISQKYCSHPNYPYVRHVGNIADSFGDEQHRICALFHDLGKLSDEFQRYIDPNDPTRTRTTHALEGAYLYFFTIDTIDENSLADFLSILKHHGDLEDIDTILPMLYHDTPEYLKADKLETIMSRSGLFGLETDMEEFCETFDSIEDFTPLMGIHTYFTIKERFSRLVFADKYEAIFKETYKNQNNFKPDEALKCLERLLEKKGKSSKIDRGKAQREIVENYRQYKDKRIFVIEAPTGVGKTFAALKLALTIAREEGKSRIITALPFTSIIEQTHSEYAKVIDESVLLKYHHLSSQKYYESQSEQEQNLQKNDYLSSTWALDNVIVTTFNQLFYAIFSNRNRDMTKFWTLRGSIVILDEVQAFPRFLLKDITKTLAYLARHFNIHFILMSATIPAIKGPLSEYPDLWTDKLLDPKIYYNQNRRYKITLNRAVDSEEKLVRRIVCYAPERSVLCVVNTKKFAKSVYDNVKEELIRRGYSNDDIYLLTTHLTPFHRRCMIHSIRRKLKAKNIVLISTQMVEAGVDVDFDIGFREFAPFGSIIQTAGRINRENTKGLCRLFVFEIPNNPHPYDKKDMLEDAVKKSILNRPLLEADILERVRTYFEIASKRTGDSTLYAEMEALKFRTAFQTFNDHFMKKNPNLTPVFVEIIKGLWQEYREQKVVLLQALQESTSLEKKMEKKLCLKRIEKKMSRLIIDVRQDQTTQLPPFMDEKRYLDFTGLKVCEYHKIKEGGQYHAREGWNGQYWDYGLDD